IECPTFSVPRPTIQRAASHHRRTQLAIRTSRISVLFGRSTAFASISFHTLILSALLKVIPADVLVLFGVFAQVIGVGFGSVEIALGIGCHPFGRDHGFVSWPRNWDEAFHDSVFGTADSDAFLE